MHIEKFQVLKFQKGENVHFKTLMLRKYEEKNTSVQKN